jgi:hypothetical protein
MRRAGETVESNPYAEPKAVDSVPLPSPQESRDMRRALRVAGLLLGFQACMKGFGLWSTVTATAGRVVAIGGMARAWPVWVVLVPGTIGFAIPLLLAVALVFGKRGYRMVAWLYADITAGLGMIGVAAMWRLGSQKLPNLYLGALCAEKIFLAAAVTLLLVGRPRTPRIVVAASLGVLHILTVLGMGWFLVP